jgi:hypothetical protein
MGLSSEEKSALRSKQKLLFSSGQFPLQGGAAARRRALKKRRSPLKTLIIGFIAFFFVVVALVILVTKAARADGGVPKKIEIEVEVRGERPTPGVVFVDGGRALLRKRMRELALEAGRPNASLDDTTPPAGPPARVRVLGAFTERGLLPAVATRKAIARARTGIGACFAGLNKAGRVRLAVDLTAAGRVSRAQVLVDQTGRKAAYACTQQALMAARWPTPTATAEGEQVARVVIDVALSPPRAASR